MQQINIELGEKSYPIYIGSGLLTKIDLFAAKITGHQVLIITNATVAKWHLASLTELLIGYQCDTLMLPDGECYKNLTELTQVFTYLIEQGHTRKTTLIALGGGVITDMTGFAAACYLRGVNYLQVPTTLLAQVDASIGGKTAVNHSLGKNLIGAFYQPQAVIIDLDTLRTLPQRYYNAGLAEIIKYGLIRDADFFAWLETSIEALLAREYNTLTYAITRSCQLKAAIVAEDERETLEIRVLLNFGHTFAHAIETGLGYEHWLHGEAVALGMLLAADLSARMGWLPIKMVARIQALLTKIGLPVRLPGELSVTRLLTLMATDKKNVASKLRLVLLQAIGQAQVTEEVMQNKLEQLLADYAASV